MNKSLKIIKYLILTGIFLTPFLALIVSSSMFFPFITGKNFIFRILVEVITALWLTLVLFDKRYRPKNSLIFLAVISFVGIIFLSAIFGENFYRSFWSNYERMEGVITYLHLLGLFIVASSVIRTEKVWNLFFHTNLGASLIVGAYGLLQLISPERFPTHQGNRIDASLGNASYLAIYMVFNIFLALILMFRQKGRVKYFYLPVIAVQVVVLYATETRGAILGMIGGALLSAIFLVVFAKNKKIKLAASSAIMGIIAIVGLFFAFKDSNFVKNNHTLNRFATISLMETTTESRLTIWKMSWEGFKEKPILGWGPENYNLVFNKYYQPVLWKQEPWFDRAHNVFFDRLTTNGILGLFSYLGLLAIALYYLWSRKKGASFSATDSALFSGMFLAYFFNNLFVFDNIISLIQFFVFIAYIHSKSSAPVPLPVVDAREQVKNSGQSSYGKATIVVIIGGLFMFIIYTANVPAIMTSRTLIDSLKAASAGKVEESFGGFQKAISYDSFGTLESREHLSNFAMQAVNYSNLDAELKKKIQDYTVDQLIKQNEEYPDDIREMVFLSAFYGKIGKYDESISVIQKAIELSPMKQQLYFELGGAYLNKGEYEKGLEVLKKAFELDEDFKDARKIYAVAAIFAGKETLAEELMKDFGGTVLADERFLRAYAQKNNYNKVVGILNLFIKNEPSNIQHRLNLAAVYLKAGKRTQSIEQIQKAVEINPSFKEQGEFYINEIKAGRNP